MEKELPILTSNLYYNHITKVRSRHAFKPRAVQPVVMRTRHWRTCITRKNPPTKFSRKVFRVY